MKPTKEYYMQQAIKLAKQGMGHTSPNPMVGCVVVKDNEIIATGYHERYGEYHAERNALLSCSKDPKGAELYVTLEPCCHQGKTPPCTDIIIEKGIQKVYIGSMDTNPLVGGKGVKKLKAANIEVEAGILEQECRELNEIFFHYIETKTPFVAMKYAMTLDGKISTYTGDSKWITGEIAREHVHKLRKKYSGIIVGIGTVLADNPMLNCRIEEGVDPVRIICDSNLSIPLDCNIVNTAKEIKTIIAYDKGEKEKMKVLEEKGMLLLASGKQGKVDLPYLMEQLGKMGMDSVLIEGGGTLHAAALEAGIVNRVYAYIAPKLIGGKEAKSPIEGKGISFMSEAFSLKNPTTQFLERDILVSGLLQ